MAGSNLDQVLMQLRRRVSSEKGWAPSQDDQDALARALHELDVYHAELEIQNQDLVQTQRALSLARDRYRALFDHAMVPFLVLSEHGVILETNIAAARLFGRPAGRLIGRPLTVCLDDGEPEAFVRHLIAVKQSRGVESSEVRVRRRDGARQVLMNSALLPSGSADAVLCQCTDVTDQRRVEREKEELRARLREAETLETVGRVAAAIAHDVNNVLVAITALGEFLKMATRDSSAERDADALLDAAWRGAHLMRGLLGLSHGPRRPHAVLDVAPLMARVAAMLRRSRSDVSVVHPPASAPCYVMGDEDELLQALLNVAKNGLEALDSGELSLSSEVAREEPNASPCVRLRVVDTGRGMSPEALARIYEPLFTTKRSRGGTGLGMTIVRKTVVEHGGTIAIESTPGKGTSVTMTLPLAAGTALAREEAPSAQSLPASMRIFIVDDDERVRDTVARQIAAAGATAIPFSGGPEALAALSADPAAASALVVDVDMPVWSGPQLVQKVYEQIAELPVLLITGAAGEQVPAALLERPRVRFLRKPWSASALVSALLSATTH